MRPYHQVGGVRLYCGDARDVVPALKLPDRTGVVVVTDPVWPNPGRTVLEGVADPLALFAAVARHVPAIARRLVVQLGCDSDPRFLLAVPPELPFVRAVWLRLAVPYPKGTVLFSGDVAYVFGASNANPGRTLLPGEVTAASTSNAARAARRASTHPCPRRMEHVAFLVGHFTGPADTVLEPFAGSGTTLVAAMRAGRQAVGVEVEERFCEETARRLDEEARQGRLIA